jgi:two-component system, sensor histidine kinase YesM
MIKDSKKRPLRWSWFNDMRMERKLLLVFLLLVTLPLAFIGYISFSNYSESIEKHTVVYSNNLLGKMMDRIDDYIEDMERISSIPAYVQDIKQNLNRSNQYHEQRSRLAGDQGNPPPEDLNLLLSIRRSIEGNMSFINHMKRGANSVYIFDQYGVAYYSTTAGGVRSNIQESYAMWRERSEPTNGDAVLFSTQQYTSNLKSTKHAFTVVRKIIDRSLSTIGLIAVDANISVIEDEITELDAVTRGKSIIVDADGHVIYDSDKRMLADNLRDDPLLSQATDQAGSFYAIREGTPSLVIYNTSSKTGWRAFAAIPVTELTKDTVIIRNVTWIATFITIGIALAISIVLSFALTNPLRKMNRLMRNVQAGDLSVRFPVKHKDEIGHLGNQFNQMLLRINDLIDDIYLIEAQKKEAELSALQNQINPHFMYNTLESIRMMAEIEDNTKVSDMISLFGKLLRYSIGDLTQRVTLKDELEHVRMFVEILNYRYPNRFDLVNEVPAELERYPLIRLVLQPIVENAVYHGLHGDNGMRINLKAEQQEQEVLLRIEDTGIGMNTSVLEQLNHSLGQGLEFKQSRSGIGLQNVNQRLKLHYGPSSGIQVFSRSGEGTVVLIRLPLDPLESAAPSLEAQEGGLQ